jgi:hypothetical protein
MAVPNIEAPVDSIKRQQPFVEARRQLAQAALARGGAHVEKQGVDVRALRVDIEKAIANLCADQE